MKSTILCLLLLATATLVSSEGGATSIITNRILNSTIYTTVNYYRNIRDGQSIYTEVSDGAPNAIKPGETKTTAIQGGFDKYELFVYDQHNRIFLSAEDTSKPINLCFKTWGTASDPQIGQTNCNAPAAHALPLSDGAAISVTNSATYSSEINLSYNLKNDQGTKEQHKETPGPINPGETKKIEIPKGAEEINFAIVNPKTKSEFLFEAKFSRPVTLCLKTWGGTDDPKISQTDC